jgi:hypothetical protein
MKGVLETGENVDMLKSRFHHEGVVGEAKSSPHDQIKWYFCTIATHRAQYAVFSVLPREMTVAVGRSRPGLCLRRKETFRYPRRTHGTVT